MDSKHKSILITGGVRSGKSNFAQDIAAKHGDKVLFVATAEARDEEMRIRIKNHQKSRPDSWTTLEAPLEIGKKIRESIGPAETVVIDCITVLVSNIILRNEDLSHSEEFVIREIQELINVITELDVTFILVTNEVGLGIVPDNKLSRIYRDCLGRANQLLAACVNEAYLLVAGIPVRLK